MSDEKPTTECELSTARIPQLNSSRLNADSSPEMDLETKSLNSAICQEEHSLGEPRIASKAESRLKKPRSAPQARSRHAMAFEKVFFNSAYRPETRFKNARQRNWGTTETHEDFRIHILVRICQNKLHVEADSVQQHVSCIATRDGQPKPSVRFGCTRDDQIRHFMSSALSAMKHGTLSRQTSL